MNEQAPLVACVVAAVRDQVQTEYLRLRGFIGLLVLAAVVLGVAAGLLIGGACK